MKERWNEIKENVKKEFDITDISYNTWIEPLKLHKVEGKEVLIMIPSDQSHALTYINNKYKTYFQVTISEMLGEEYFVSFILEKDANPDVTTNDMDKRAIYNMANLNPKYTFDTFVVGSNNRFAQSAALAAAESPGEVYNPLYLYGGPGLGKTHLMHSIGHFILKQNPEKKVLYVTSEEFTNEVIESIRSGDSAAKMAKLRDKYRTVDVLLIDDVQFIIGKESTQEEFFHTFNTLHAAGKQIVLSSDKPPKEMATLDERFRSRFEWGLIADINPPDYETRMAILRKNVEISEKKLDDRIIDYIATNVKSNIRELEGALKKVFAASLLVNSDVIDFSVAEDALKDIIYPDAPKEITPSYIINVVAEHYHIMPEDITSKKRNAEIVQPRQISMYLIRSITDISFQQIAKIMNKKDHTTVMHGVEKIEQEIKVNEELYNKVETIRKKINPS